MIITMFRSLIKEAREAISEVNRIMAPPKPTVGAGRRPQAQQSPLKPSITPAQKKPHGMGGTGLDKQIDGSKPAAAVAGQHKPWSDGKAMKTFGNTSSRFDQHATVNRVMGNAPRKPKTGHPEPMSTAKTSSKSSTVTSDH